MFLRTQPLGVNPPHAEQRMPVWQVTSGDDWQLSVRLTTPWNSAIPAQPENSRVVFALAQDRFSETPIWTGHWNDGIVEADPVNHPGLVSVRIPDTVAATLRRGQYVFSITVADNFGQHKTTVLAGAMLVEYEATSPIHDIPYRRD